MNQFLKIATFLNLIDAQGKLSITNVAVYITLIKLAISPSASITEAGTLLLALANYTAKKIINKQPTKQPEDTITPQVDELKEKLEVMSGQVSALALNAGLIRK